MLAFVFIGLQIRTLNFLLNGIDRPSVKSLFTPNTRFIEVIEEGFSGGNVIPATFQGSDEDLKKVRENVNKSSEVGRTVATDFTGALADRIAGMACRPAGCHRLEAVVPTRSATNQS